MILSNGTKQTQKTGVTYHLSLQLPSGQACGCPSSIWKGPTKEGEYIAHEVHVRNKGKSSQSAIFSIPRAMTCLEALSNGTRRQCIADTDPTPLPFSSTSRQTGRGHSEFRYYDFEYTETALRRHGRVPSQMMPPRMRICYGVGCLMFWRFSSTIPQKGKGGGFISMVSNIR